MQQEERNINQYDKENSHSTSNSNKHDDNYKDKKSKGIFGFRKSERKESKRDKKSRDKDKSDDSDELKAKYYAKDEVSDQKETKRVKFVVPLKDTDNPKTGQLYY